MNFSLLLPGVLVFVWLIELIEWLTPAKPVCPQCGIQLESLMGYVCPRSDCPCFPKATC
jgi:hypothetical protein